MLQIVKHRKIPFIFSSILFVTSLGLLATFGLKLGIDFTGGTLMEVSFSEERPAVEQVEETLAPLEIDGLTVQPAGEDAYILKMAFISEDQHQEVLGNLRSAFEQAEDTTLVDEPIDPAKVGKDVEGETVIVDTEGGQQMLAQKVFEERIETIGPSVSSQLRNIAIYTGGSVIFAIIIYVAYAFRKVSRPVQSWKYGITAIIALIHDVVIVMGVFALLGAYAGVEVNIPFVVALMTVLGYSVNDTIVVFDRVREVLIKDGYQKFEETVNKGVNGTLVRSLNTSLTTLLVLGALYFFGGAGIKHFSLALIIGIISGTYSSIFLASPLLVVWSRLKRK